MTLWQKVLLFCSFALSLFGVHRLSSLDRRFDEVFAEIRSLPFQNEKSTESAPETLEHPVSDALERPDDYLRGDYQYSYLGTYPQLYFQGNLVKERMITEYGYCLKITKDYALCVDGNKRTFLLPASTARPPKTTAFALDGEAGEEFNPFSRARARLD